MLKKKRKKRIINLNQSYQKEQKFKERERERERAHNFVWEKMWIEQEKRYQIYQNKVGRRRVKI